MVIGSSLGICIHTYLKTQSISISRKTRKDTKSDLGFISGTHQDARQHDLISLPASPFRSHLMKKEPSDWLMETEVGTARSTVPTFPPATKQHRNPDPEKVPGNWVPRHGSDADTR